MIQDEANMHGRQCQQEWKKRKLCMRPVISDNLEGMKKANERTRAMASSFGAPD